MKEAGVRVLDYVIVSHNHGDHVGNAADLPNLPLRNIRQFLDHGPYTTELQPNQRASFERYLGLRKIAKARRAEPVVYVDIARVMASRRDWIEHESFSSRGAET